MTVHGIAIIQAGWVNFMEIWINQGVAKRSLKEKKLPSYLECVGYYSPDPDFYETS